MNNERKLGAIILAAGQGKRMQTDGVNKVTLELHKKPIMVGSNCSLDITDPSHLRAQGTFDLRIDLVVGESVKSRAA